MTEDSEFIVTVLKALRFSGGAYSKQQRNINDHHAVIQSEGMSRTFQKRPEKSHPRKSGDGEEGRIPTEL